MLKFSDGEEFDLSGTPRIEKRYDGLYVLGNNLMIPVEDHHEGNKYVTQISKTQFKPTDCSLTNSILHRALNSNFIHVLEANDPDIRQYARWAAENHYGDKEIGSSDMTFIVKEFMGNMGRETYWNENGFLTLKEVA